jgi:hypothetical protein
VHGYRISRAATLGAALAIVSTLVLGSVTALAGNTRGIEINSAGANPGVLTTTPVSAGQDFLLNVTVTNAGGQTLNHGTVVIGRDDLPAVAEAQPQTAITPTYPVAFTDGTTIVSSTPACSKPDANGPLTCTFGTLTKGKSFSVDLVINAANSDLALKATTKVAENANDNGANIDTFAAETVVDVLAPSCSGLFGYLPLGQAKQLTTSGLSCDQAIDLKVPAGATTKSTIISTGLVSEPTSSSDCGGASTCFGDAFSISVNDGAKVNGYIETTFVWASVPSGFNINKAAVVHIGATKTVVISTANKDKCSANKTTNCWVSSSFDGTTWTFTVRFPENGLIRGKS